MKMTIKDLKIELFNIYDIVVFKDENGITQDCVCSIGKDEIEGKIIDVVECNSHRIDIFESGNYMVWKKDGIPYYPTDQKIIHLYTLKNDNKFYEVYLTNNYESIENASSSEVMKELERIENNIIYLLSDCDINEEVNMNFNSIMEHKSCEIIKQYILKSQEQEKVPEIIFKKDVNIKALKHYLATYDNSLALKLYNSNVNNDERLTQEEFDLLKRYFDRKENK